MYKSVPWRIGTAYAFVRGRGGRLSPWDILKSNIRS
jgi:hypothetical protein